MILLWASAYCCITVFMHVFLYILPSDPETSFLFFSFSFVGRSRWPGTTGKRFPLTSLWLVDECDCVYLPPLVPQQNCGQKVWNAWNSWDRVLPMWPNTTSIPVLLVSTSAAGRRTCEKLWEICTRVPLKQLKNAHFYFVIGFNLQFVPTSRRALLSLNNNNQRPVLSSH